MSLYESNGCARNENTYKKYDYERKVDRVLKAIGKVHY